jgi:NAD-dependent SIR2 family protein deacetylase
LCGAGISTSVGVPDFRSETGVYRDEETKKMFDAATFDSDPSVMYRGCKKLFGLASNASLSAAHRLFGMLEKKGKLLRIYDQVRIEKKGVLN